MRRHNFKIDWWAAQQEPKKPPTIGIAMAALPRYEDEEVEIIKQPSVNPDEIRRKLDAAFLRLAR